MDRVRRVALVALSLLACVTRGASAQGIVPLGGDTRSVPDVPFSVGETLEFDVSAKWGIFGGSGDASLRVEAIDTVRGSRAYRLASDLTGGILVLGVDHRDRSWLDVERLFSHRFQQKHEGTGGGRDRTYEFLPQRMRYVDAVRPADHGLLATREPLDDVSYVYYLRTLPLRAGDVYTESRYYKAEGNPVTIRVLRRERITVPAGTFNAVVVRPIIRTDGLFREEGEAEIWISDDDRRLILKLRAKAKVGTLEMVLRAFEEGG